MKLDYEYLIHQITPDGFATVEYVSKELGSVTKYMSLPYDKPELMHLRVVENFPVDMFYGMWLKENRIPIPEGFRGSFSIDFDDSFFSVVDEATSHL